MCACGGPPSAALCHADEQNPRRPRVVCPQWADGKTYVGPAISRPKLFAGKKLIHLDKEKTLKDEVIAKLKETAENVTKHYETDLTNARK